MWYKWVRSLLFTLDAEVSHDLTLQLLQVLTALKVFAPVPYPKTALKVMGLHFANPIGLAAGLDKDGTCLRAWEGLGFGFIEVGTVTPQPQVGNPKPRLFRLVSDHAIINRMGFNNQGITKLIERLRSTPVQCPVGVNIGKNRDTPLEKASEDYQTCYEQVYPFADYVTVNLSSPNTPGLKDLQHGDRLKNILLPLIQTQMRLADVTTKFVPIAVKISPDLKDDDLKATIDTLLDLKINAVIASNTTIERGPLISDQRQEVGGLSGAPLFSAATSMVKKIYSQVGNDLPIIAVGGIMTAEQAQEKLVAGAQLIQLYSGLIYRGPTLIKEIKAILP